MKKVIGILSFFLFVNVLFSQGSARMLSKNTTVLNKKKLATKRIGGSKFYLIKGKDLRKTKSLLKFANGVNAYFFRNQRGPSSISIQKGSKRQNIRLQRGHIAGGNRLASPGGSSEYNCNSVWCTCSGDLDCNQMVSGSACASNRFNQPVGFCFDYEDKEYCVCVQN